MKVLISTATIHAVYRINIGVTPLQLAYQNKHNVIMDNYQRWLMLIFSYWCLIVNAPY